MITFNRNLLLTIGILAIVILVKLYSIAVLTANWRGFWYTTLHIVIVAIGSYFALRSRKDSASIAQD